MGNGRCADHPGELVGVEQHRDLFAADDVGQLRCSESRVEEHHVATQPGSGQPGDHERPPVAGEHAHGVLLAHAAVTQVGCQ